MKKLAYVPMTLALGGTLQADHMPEQSAFARAALTHDDKDGATLDPRIDVAHDDVVPIGHGQMLNLDFGFVREHVAKTGTARFTEAAISYIQCMAEHGKHAVGSNNS